MKLKRLNSISLFPEREIKQVKEVNLSVISSNCDKTPMSIRQLDQQIAALPHSLLENMGYNKLMTSVSSDTERLECAWLWYDGKPWEQWRIPLCDCLIRSNRDRGLQYFCKECDPGQ